MKVSNNKRKVTKKLKWEEEKLNFHTEAQRTDKWQAAGNNLFWGDFCHDASCDRFICSRVGT